MWTKQMKGMTSHENTFYERGTEIDVEIEIDRENDFL